MPGPTSLEELEKELLALGDEAMLIGEFDGFVAGLLVCPDLIKPGEWLPVILGEDQSPFENLDHANRVLALVMEHYNRVALTLLERPDRYAPLFPVDERNGDVLWEMWIEGFQKAVALRPAAWKGLLDADAETAAAIAGLLTLVAVAGGDERPPKKTRDPLIATAPDDIARWIATLNAWRLDRDRPKGSAGPMARPPVAAPQKVGRNDPCPCGSGRKYKKCCGANRATNRSPH